MAPDGGRSLCPFNIKIITKSSGSRGAPATPKSKRPFASSRGSTIRTWPRIKKGPRKNSRKSTRPTKFWVTRRNGKNTTNWARTGNPARNFVHRQVGKDSAAASLSPAGGRVVRISNSASAAPVSVISSSRSSAPWGETRRLWPVFKCGGTGNGRTWPRHRR